MNVNRFETANNISLDELQKTGVIVKYVPRKIAAAIAISMTLIMLILPIYILFSAGIESGIEIMTTRSGVSASPYIVVLAMLYWVLRYTVPALSAIFQSAPYIEKVNDQLRFFGNQYPISEVNGFVVKKSILRSSISIILNGKYVSGGSTLFMRKVTDHGSSD